MNPTNMVSIVDKVLGIEQLTANANLKFGGKTEVKVEIGQIITNVYAGTISPTSNPDLIATTAQELKSPSPSSSPSPSPENDEQDAFIVLSPYLGIVKSKELPGTRVQLEFTVTNNLDRPIVLRGALLNLNNGEVNFKKFYKVRNDGSREPDFVTRFPIIINSRGSTRLGIEFENIEKPLIEKGDLNGELVVLIDQTQFTTKSFIFEVNDAMMNTLPLFQEQATSTGVPVVFDAMIKS